MNFIYTTKQEGIFDPVFLCENEVFSFCVKLLCITLSDPYIASELKTVRSGKCQPQRALLPYFTTGMLFVSVKLLKILKKTVTMPSYNEILRV